MPVCHATLYMLMLPAYDGAAMRVAIPRLRRDFFYAIARYARWRREHAARCAWLYAAERRSAARRSMSFFARQIICRAADASCAMRRHTIDFRFITLLILFTPRCGCQRLPRRARYASMPAAIACYMMPRYGAYTR